MFDYLFAAAVGIFAAKVRRRNGWLWGGICLFLIGIGQMYILMGGGNSFLWTAFVVAGLSLLLAALKPGKIESEDASAAKDGNKREGVSVYDVVITGFIGGKDPAEVKGQLAQLFQATPRQIEEICVRFPYTVKSSIDAATGARYRTSLERAGVHCEVVERSLSADLPSLADDAPVQSSTAIPVVHASNRDSSLVTKVIYGIGAVMVLGGLAARGYDYIAKQSSGTGIFPATVASVKSAASPHEQKLRKHAMEDLHQSKFSLAKRDGLCDRIADEEFDFTFGTAAINVDGSEKRRTLPAAVVHHRFTCIMNALAQKESEEQWNILALDDEFQMLRCIRTGPAQIVASNYVECGFQPSDGSPPKFPPADRVDEPFRAKYSQLLAKIHGQGTQPTEVASSTSAAPKAALALYEQLHSQKPAAVWTDEDAASAVRILASATGEEARQIVNEARESSQNACATASCFNGQREFEAARRLLTGEAKTVEEALR